MVAVVLTHFTDKPLWAYMRRFEKLLSDNVFHSYISLVHQNAALFGNGLTVTFWTRAT